MLQTLKKVFSTFVTLTTILWSVGVGSLVLPSAASAATLGSGDLIKASGPAVYYYGADGKRYVFPNSKTYFTWYADFSSVKTITDAELAAIQIGSNVTYRPGVKMIKITTDPKAYAVDHNGSLHWIESEAVATALYGANWNQMIDDVPDGFFVNYTVGSSVPNASAFNVAAVTAAATTINCDKDITCGGAVVGGNLSVTLATDTPAGMTVPKNASSVSLVKVNLTAGSSDVNITGLTFHRVGVGSVNDFSNVYLYDQSGLRLTTGRTINSQSNLASFNSLNITVKAGQTWSVLVYGDFSSPSTTGGQHAFELADAASVIVSGGATISGNFPVRGNTFTVGTTASARVDINKGTTPSNPTIGSKNVEISNFKVTANTNDVKLNQITLYQAGSITNSDLTNLMLYQGSTLVATGAGVGTDGHMVLKFTNPYLIGNGTTKVFSLHADVGGRSGRTIRTYVEYTTDVTAIDQVYLAGAAICISPTSGQGGCTAGSQGSFDGTSSGTNYVEVTTQGGTLTNAFNGPATQNIAKGQLSVPLYKLTLSSADNDLEIRNFRFSIAKTSGSASTCYVKGSAGTTYFRSIKLKDMDTGVTVMGPIDLSSSLANSSTGSGAMVFTDSWNLLMGQSRNLAIVADLSNSEDVAGEFFNTGLCAYQVSFAAFQSNDVRVVSTGEFLDTSKIVPNTAVTGNAQTVKASSLTVALASSPVSGTIVKKQQNVAVAGLALTASAQSDITITSLTLAGQSDKASAGCAGFGTTSAGCNQTDFSTRVTSLALYNGDVQVGLAKAPDTTTGKAQISNMNLLIPKGTTLTLTVKASLSSSASSTAPYDKIAVGIASTSDMSVQDQDSNTVTPTISSSVTGQATGASPAVTQTIRPSGTVTIQADAHPSSNIVIAGKDAWVPFAQYKATAQFENVTIDRIAILSSSTAGLLADNADFSAVAIAQGGAVKAQDVLSAGATGTKDIDLSANTITIPKDGSLSFQLWAKLSNVQASGSVNGTTTGVARSGNAPALGLNNGILTGEWDSNYSGKLNVRSTGAASGERIYATSGAAHGNAEILRKSVPIVTKQSLSNTVLGSAGAQDLIKFQISADAAGSIAWKQAIFNFSKTSGVTLSNFRLLRNGTDMNTGGANSVYGITNGTSTTDLYSNSIASGDTSGFVVVSLVPNQEESISGSGNVYTLRAEVGGSTGSGRTVSFSFYRDPTAPVVTGYLKGASAFSQLGSSANIFNIDTSDNGGGAAAATGTFLWSDNSEVPHSAANNTSRDWTNDVYVQDLSTSQSLSS